MDSTPTNSRPRVLAMLALLGAALLLYAPTTLFQIPVSTDMTMMYAPFYSLKWEGGIFGIPLWNPHLACGMGMEGNLQYSALYPLRFPFYFMDDWRTYFGPYMFVHYVIALVGAFGAFRASGMSRPASLVGAIVFGCGGYVSSRIINTTIFLATCWFPWLVWGAVERRTRGGPILTLAISMIMLIGSPHLMIYGTIGFAIVWICSLLGAPTSSSAFAREVTRAPGILLIRDWTPWIRLTYYMLGFIAGLVALVPGMLQVLGSLRTKTNIENNLADSLGWDEIPFALLGGAGGAITPEVNDKCIYIGGAAILLVLIGTVHRAAWRDWRCRAGVALTLAGLILALGKNIGWQWIMPYIPGLKMLEGPARALVLTAFGMAWLAAIRIERLLQDAAANGPIWRLRTAAIGIAFLLVTAILIPLRLDGFDSAQALIMGWLVAPGAVIGHAFAPLDLVLTLIPAILFLCLPARLAQFRVWGFGGLILFQLWHFAPRVAPHTAEKHFFDPPANVRFLMEENEKSHAQGERFRIAALDVLQYTDTQWDSLHKFSFLMPNLATLYGLEDIRGFDPLIPRNHAEVVTKLAGRAPYNDPIRNLEFNEPSEQLFEMLGVRFLIGDPRDRRWTTQPQFLHAQQPISEVPSSTRWVAHPEIAGWRFVSLIDGAGSIRPGEEIARLVIEANEGTFEFPLRYGIESGHVSDSENVVAQTKAQVNMRWQENSPHRESNYQRTRTNYRATIDFGRPLHAKRVSWRLTRSDLIVYFPAQGYRLAATEPPNTWKLAFADPVAPVYERTAFRPESVKELHADHRFTGLFYLLSGVTLAAYLAAAMRAWYEWKRKRAPA